MRIVFWVVAILVIALDQWTKHLVLANLSYGETVRLPLDLVYLTYVQNPGVAFGQLKGAGPILIVGATAAVVAIVVYRARLLQNGRLHPLLSLGLALPLGGAVGNLIDRVRLGEVVDFIELHFIQFPIFNVADIAITVGAVTLLIYFGLMHRQEARTDDPAESQAPAATPGMAEARD